MFILCGVQKTNAQQDSVKALPFAIADEKRLSDEDLANKKEGTYVTGLPDLSSDPINGFGYGVEGSVFFNGKKSDPFFAYTPYRAELDVVLFNTSRSQREAMITLDVPYIFSTKWRLRVEAGYENNPNLLYFGESEKSLSGLSFYPNGDVTKPMVNNADYADYANAMDANYPLYNTYTKDEYILNVSGERSYLEGRFRALVGFEMANINITSKVPYALISQDARNNGVIGFQKALVNIAQLGLIYDTRDLETDPGSGIFAEITNEWSNKSVGSKYNFNKTFAHVNFYKNLIKNRPKQMVLAMRFAAGYTGGSAPFFEYQDQWSSEGSIEGLGGSGTLRGYKQSRFLARTMTFVNTELRIRIAEKEILKQHLAFGLVPFFDFGGVANNVGDVFQASHNRYSEGLGARIAWNVNTILRFDYAVSKEDKQFFFSFGHMF